MVRALLSALRFRRTHPACGGAFGHHVDGTRTSRAGTWGMPGR
jgi:hypothetical protein